MEPLNVLYPPNIDPAECILAVVGIRPLLSAEVERITRPMWTEIERLDRTIREQSKALADGHVDREKAYPQIDYEPTLKAFSSPPKPDQVEAMLQDIPAGQDLPFLAAAARAYNFLRGQYPICVERTVFGANQLEPGDFALGAFEDLLQVIDQPLSIFGMIESGRLTTKQAAAMQAVYPTLYPEIAIEVVGACMAKKGDQPGWEPEFGRGISVLLGIPGVDPGLLAALQATKPQPEEQTQQRPAPGRSQRAHLIATKSDRLELEE